MRCTFCDVPNVEWHGNATFEDLKAQLYNAIGLFPQVKYTERLNLHYARMGDPIFNEAVFEFARWLYANKRQIAADTGLRIEVIHPVLTTSSPRKFKRLEERILEWCEMFSGMQIRLADLAKIAEKMPEPKSRKYCLNFAYATSFEVDAKLIASLFDSRKFMCKITPIHNNNACRANNIQTIGGYDSYHPYRRPEEDLKGAGFDVLVFVPSLDEEDGLVTCGNAVLGGSSLKTNEDIIKIEGLTAHAS